MPNPTSSDAYAGDTESVFADSTDATAPPSPVPKDHPDFREPSDAVMAQARMTPHHWFYLIDRHWSGHEDEIPPSWAQVGRWRSDRDGEIVTWEPNPDYRPSPDAHGWGPPAGNADAASHLVAAGYESPVMLPVVLADAEVAVLLDEQGNPAVVEGPGGRPAVPVFSASPRPTDDLPSHEVMFMPSLLDRMPEGSDVLFLSSSAPVCQTIAPAALRAAREWVERYEGKGSDVPDAAGRRQI